MPPHSNTKRFTDYERSASGDVLPDGICPFIGARCLQVYEACHQNGTNSLDYEIGDRVAVVVQQFKDSAWQDSRVAFEGDVCVDSSRMDNSTICVLPDAPLSEVAVNVPSDYKHRGVRTNVHPVLGPLAIDMRGRVIAGDNGRPGFWRVCARSVIGQTA